MTPQRAGFVQIIDAPRPRLSLAQGKGESGTEDDGEIWPSDSGSEPVDPVVLAECALLDHSDTDNGKRLLKHFGDSLRVLMQGDARDPSYAAWREKFWDIECGNLYAHAVAQKIGGRIGLEADYIAMTPYEEHLSKDGERAEEDLALLEKRKESWNEKDLSRAKILVRVIEAGNAARDAVKKRQVARRKFAVSSKYSARIKSMSICAGPHCAVERDAFNPDPYLFATNGHTLRFVRERADECPDTDSCRWTARVEAVSGHRREDMLTRHVPHDYDPDAKCPRIGMRFWKSFCRTKRCAILCRRFLALG